MNPGLIPIKCIAPYLDEIRLIAVLKAPSPVFSPFPLLCPIFSVLTFICPDASLFPWLSVPCSR